MAFTEKMPEWQAEGIEPPDSKKQAGWDVEDKPPAGWWNWVWNRTWRVLKEIREKAAEKEWVSEQIAGVKVEVPDASLTQKGITQLSNATDGTRENVASTEKAAKAAYDRGSAGVTAAGNVQTSLTAHLADYVRQPAYATTAGTATAYTVTLDPAPGTISEGFGITIVPHVANGVNPTLKIGSLAAIALKDQKGVAYAAGKLQVGKPYTFRKVGSDFLADSGSGAEGNATAGDLRAGKTATNETGEVITGTLAERTTTTITPSESAQNFLSGIYPAFIVGAAPDKKVRINNISIPANSFYNAPLSFVPVMAALELSGSIQVIVNSLANGGVGSSSKRFGDSMVLQFNALSSVMTVPIYNNSAVAISGVNLLIMG
ncbi:phage tail protein [Paenibacillus sp. SAF-054]|uniref:phage tail protein n=1 Tax=unclassified Paenibacillus TaxID=185978 RepID=UPI003F7F4CE9